MKTLKITLLLAAILLLTVSGTTTGNSDESQNEIKQSQKHYDLLAHTRYATKLPKQH